MWINTSHVIIYTYCSICKCYASSLYTVYREDYRSTTSYKLYIMSSLNVSLTCLESSTTSRLTCFNAKQTNAAKRPGCWHCFMSVRCIEKRNSDLLGTTNCDFWSAKIDPGFHGIRWMDPPSMQSRNFGPMRESVPIARATSFTSAPVLSQSLAVWSADLWMCWGLMPLDNWLCIHYGWWLKSSLPCSLMGYSQHQLAHDIVHQHCHGCIILS